MQTMNNPSVNRVAPGNPRMTGTPTFTINKLTKAAPGSSSSWGYPQLGLYTERPFMLTLQNRRDRRQQILILPLLSRPSTAVVRIHGKRPH